MNHAEEKNETQFKGVWIPSEVWEMEISWMLKCLWANIYSMSKKGKPCTASHQWLAQRMGTSPKAISMAISQLRQAGLVVDGKFDGRVKEIYGVFTPDVAATNTDRQVQTQPCNSHNLMLAAETPAYKVQNYHESTPKSPEGNLSVDVPENPSEPPKPRRKVYVHPAAVVILEHLNKCAGRAFTAVDAHLEDLSKRLWETKNDLEGIKKMVERQCTLWRGDEMMDKFLRPSTLFCKKRFYQYYDDRDLPVEAKRPQPSPVVMPVWEMRKLLETKQSEFRKMTDHWDCLPMPPEIKTKWLAMRQSIDDLKAKIAATPV